jgi:hypothetical protein
VTVFDRTTSALTITDAEQTLTVAGCGEASASNFRINAWTITGLGLHTLSTGSGSFGPHAYIVVTRDAAPSQTDTRPPNLPPCEGVPGRLSGAVPGLEARTGQRVERPPRGEIAGGRTGRAV